MWSIYSATRLEAELAHVCAPLGAVRFDFVAVLRRNCCVSELMRERFTSNPRIRNERWAELDRILVPSITCDARA